MNEEQRFELIKKVETVLSMQNIEPLFWGEILHVLKLAKIGAAMPQLGEIPLMEWVPWVGDVVQWPNYKQFTVFYSEDGSAVIEMPDESLIGVEAAIPIIRAARCTIMRPM